MSTLIQKKAPNFTAEAVMEDNKFKKITLSDFYNKNYVILFFYPLDFTFVCPSEILALSNRIKEFEKRNVKVFGISIDSHFSHLAWRNTKVENGGIGEIYFPLISDINKEISKDFDVLINNSISLRATFLIDKSGIIRHTTINDLSLGRNIDETLRMIDALQFNEKYGDVCPAGWTKGKQAIKPNTDGIASYLKDNFDKI